MSRSRSRSPRREQSCSPPRERRPHYSPPRGRGGYDRDYDRGYDREPYYERGYDRGYYGDRERDYYNGGYDSHSRGGGYGGYHENRGYGGAPYGGQRKRSPPRRRPVFKGDETDRLTSKCLFVGNMPYSFREEEVMDLFDKCGKISSVSVPMDKYTGRNKGFAFVTFEERVDAEDAKAKYESHQVEGRTLRIDWDVGFERKKEAQPEVHRESVRSD